MVSRFICGTFNNPYEEFNDVIDTKTATQLLEMITSIVNGVLGFLVLAVLIGFVLVTSLDIIYILNPSVHYEIEDKARASGSDKRMFGLISKSAIRAYEEGIETGKSIVLLYLKYRGKVYIVASIAVWAMIAGYSTIVNAVARLISGVLNSIM